MSRYSLINVSKEYIGYVDGTWIQDHTGTLNSAIQVAKRTEKANSNRIKVAVVEGLNNSSSDYSHKTGLLKLG